MITDDIRKAMQKAFVEQIGLEALKQGLNLVSIETQFTARGIKIRGVYESKVDAVFSKPRQVGPKLRKTKRGTQRVSGYRLPPPTFEKQIEAVEQDEKFKVTAPPAVSKFISTQLGTLSKHLTKISL